MIAVFDLPRWTLFAFILLVIPVVCVAPAFLREYRRQEFTIKDEDLS